MPVGIAVCADGIREKDRDLLGALLKSVSVINKDNTYTLARHAWQDVRSDWPLYTDADRQLVKKYVCLVRTTYDYFLAREGGGGGGGC